MANIERWWRLSRPGSTSLWLDYDPADQIAEGRAPAWEDATVTGPFVLEAATEGAVDTVTHAIVMLAGLAEPWDALDHAERCARAENELRALLDRLEGR